MKFKVYMKTPDALDYACAEAATSWDEEENEVIDSDVFEDLKEICAKWFEYDECITLEVDTETNTIKVLPV